LLTKSSRRTRRPRATAHRTPRKEEILEVAAELFALHGFDAVSLADIAQAVGLSKATLYHYFDRKEEILGTIVVSTIRALNAFVEGAMQGIASPEERLLAFLEAQADFFEQNQTSFQVLLTRVNSVTEPRVRDIAIEWRISYENTVKRIIQDGIASGAFRAGTQSSTVRAVLGSLYWLARWYRPQGRLRARDIAREYADVVLYGVAVRPAPPDPS
jgi:AcrR family transcriptional regulator